MKLTYLEISNFKAIENVILDNLQDVILIVGQNGVGKSCIFDAIRILKTAYGNYNSNEWSSLLNEFQISDNGVQMRVDNILRDKANPLVIKARIKLSPSEKDYLKEKAEAIIQKELWDFYTHTNQAGVHGGQQINSHTQNHVKYSDTILQETKEAKKRFDELINNDELEGSVQFTNDGNPIIPENQVLEILFNTYEPEKLGVIDYHGAHRNYQKENITNLNVNFGNERDIYKDSALYNYTNKYNNVKNEMASSYVKALIARESGEGQNAIDSLNQSLTLLFEQFFPGKKFKGIMPSKNGTLDFPVELATGNQHDIGDLSSGEKEVLFGYLRLRNQAPKNSIILIDEPELHLNPKLAKKLPEFYYKTIGIEWNNQLWLVTHSDAILKEAVGLQGFSLYHMIEADNSNKNQAREISINHEIEAAVIDLIGDISSFQYGNKVVVFESVTAEFDKKTVNNLFPEFEKKINSISAGNKTNVHKVQAILKKASEDGIIDKRFFSIVDRDSAEQIMNSESFQYSWDVYHIENFLLNDEYIFKVMQDLNLNNPQIKSPQKIGEELRIIAENDKEFHIRHQIQEFVAKELKSCLKTSCGSKKSIIEGFNDAALQTIASISKKSTNELSLEKLGCMQELIEAKLNKSLTNNDWRKEFRGREILNKFVVKYAKGILYEPFRNLIISRMKKDNYQPEGMKVIIDKILAR